MKGKIDFVVVCLFVVAQHSAGIFHPEALCWMLTSPRWQKSLCHDALFPKYKQKSVAHSCWDEIIMTWQGARQICSLPSVQNAFRSNWLTHQLSQYGNTFVPLFPQLIGFIVPMLSEISVFSASSGRHSAQKRNHVCEMNLCEDGSGCGSLCVYLMMSMCPFLAARWRGDVPLGSVVSPFLGSSRAAHMLLDSNNWTTYTQTHTQSKQNPFDRFYRLTLVAIVSK